MLTRHLRGKAVKIGVGANRAATAACFFKRHGYVDPRDYLVEGKWHEQKEGSRIDSRKVGVVVLDDGMQVLFPLCFSYHVSFCLHSLRVCLHIHPYVQ
jgi:tetraacyldisaccharide 4'-kinase